MATEKDKSDSTPRVPQIRLLIVDDEPAGTDARAAMLRSLGYDAVVSYSGIEALARFDLDSFHAIILDYDMPVMNGIDTARSLRQLGVHAGLVMLSGRIDAPPEIGVVDVFVSKGEGVPSLTSAIETALAAAYLRGHAAAPLIKPASKHLRPHPRKHF